MNGSREPVSRARIDGVFVLGMHASGIELVHELLCNMGFFPLGANDEATLHALAGFNDQLLSSVGGTSQNLPESSPLDSVRLLAPFADDARTLFADTSLSPEKATRPWVWGDPRNSFLASFWSKSLAINAGVVLVHRDPQVVAMLLASDPRHFAEVLTQWARFNVAALVQCSVFPAAIVSYEELVTQSDESLSVLEEFSRACGVSPNLSVEATAKVLGDVGLDVPATSPTMRPRALEHHHEVLARSLGHLNGLHTSSGIQKSADSERLVDEIANFYDESYYGPSYDKSGIPYGRDEKFWVDFFSKIADEIVTTLRPRTALDVGCASGMLVEALRERGVDARGIDISPWAIGQVPDDLRPYCRIGSITDEIDGGYDVITCFEVLEHLPAFLAETSVANLCRHSTAILFSSTPTDFDEPTHLNVEPVGYWARLFLRQGFVRDVDFDASFVARHAVLFRRRPVQSEDLIQDYERALSETTMNMGTRLENAVAEHDRLAERFNANVDETKKLVVACDHLRGEVVKLQDALREAQRIRSEETVAATAAIRAHEIRQQELSAELNRAQSDLDAIRATKTFRYTSWLRRVYGRVLGKQRFG